MRGFSASQPKVWAIQGPGFHEISRDISVGFVVLYLYINKYKSRLGKITKTLKNHEITVLSSDSFDYRKRPAVNKT